MTRIPYLDNEIGLDGEALQVSEYIKASRGNVIGVFALLLNSPKVAKLVADLGAYLRFDSILPQRLKELVILTTLSEHSCQFEWSYHQEYALQADISVHTMEVIKFKKPLYKNGQPTREHNGLASGDGEIITYVRELINNKRVSDKSFNRLRQAYSTEQITEITTLIGYYAMVACQLNAYELPAAPGKPSLPEPKLPQTQQTLAEEMQNGMSEGVS
ncbi:carboxymuconolactone decarboxylase family protein [Thalassomonas viridans]|uniref:Carboxymuconolactone decarboxylase family protein n=1 Tax=Thalassomonas viridans TaxID=137584 RepID=A0AAE9Z7K5_9GAMM|nr:carboxymuconolactone decarboxylase family protein [Thalassomonas viridans]WDE07459.1 carboxymuconolactone decarboxylase family protein [Thalassomonas viridans]